MIQKYPPLLIEVSNCGQEKEEEEMDKMRTEDNQEDEGRTRVSQQDIDSIQSEWGCSFIGKQVLR